MLSSASTIQTACCSTSSAHPKEVNRLELLSRRARRLEPSAIRKVQPLLRLPGMISLGGGMPNPQTFPIESLSMNLKVLGGQDTDDTKSNPKPMRVDLPDHLVGAALQYSPSYGLPELLEQLTLLCDREHGQDPSGDRAMCVWNGSQHGLAVAFDILLDENDALVVEVPTYSGALAALRPLGTQLLGAPTDHLGLVPEKLEKLLESRKKSGATMPKALYTIPTGQNPSGASQSNERKARIYEIACTYNLLVIEDDPYWFLHFEGGEEKEGQEESRRISYLSLDTQQDPKFRRVLRFDSFSKIVASGLRMGVVTGPSDLVEKMQLYQQATTLHPSGLSQAVLCTLLAHWGPGGFRKHINSVRKFYRLQRDAFMSAAQTHLGQLVDLEAPEAGMFAWMRAKGISDTDKLIAEKAADAKVILISGESFFHDSRKSPYLRASYSTATPAEMDTALQRLSLLIQEYQK